MRQVLLLFTGLLLCACNTHNPNHTSLYRDDGHRKPAVALVPVIDQSDSALPWSLSDEFTDTLRDKLISHNKMHIADEIDVAMALDQLDDSSQPFTQEMQWMKKAFKEEQFVVFCEIVDHYLHTHHNQRIAELEDNRDHYLDLTMRVRIVDLRSDTPKVVLQELIQHQHSIPKLFAGVDYSEKSWGKTSFNFTPVGLAHAQMLRELTTRIEDYIGIAHTR